MMRVVGFVDLEKSRKLPFIVKYDLQFFDSVLITGHSNANGGVDCCNTCSAPEIWIVA